MDNFSFVRRLSRLTTWLETLFCAHLVGTDPYGNHYYRARKTPIGQREKRWVMYANEPEASKVPPEWHGWLHHTMPTPIASDSPLRKSWQKPHLQNMTGTPDAYLPTGHVLAEGIRPKATGDYEAWSPDQSTSR